MSNITVPYSVNRIDGHSSSYSKGNFTFSTSINLPKAQPTYLWFQHADQSADIYVDDTKVTTHWGGYAAFFTDISNYVHAGINNIRVVLCNTTRNTLAPCSADFNFNATLGNVKVLTSPVLPAMIYGYDGFHITATNVSSAAATLTIKTSVPVGATVVCKIDDDDSNYHFYEEKPSTGEEMSFITTITNPTLWNGKINPHLYDVTLEIYKNGDIYHRFQRGYGIRYYSYVYNYTLPNNETYTGFLLNGSPYLLRGVCMHDDLEGKANALDDNDYTQEFAIIQEVGCNFIRLAHYPHPKEVYDWCDRLGIIVQTEAPMVNVLKSTHPEDYYTHLEGQYYDMVTQHYNHPCIVFWGLGNEFNAQMDDTSFACTKLEHFRDIIKTYDTERMVGCVLNANSANPRTTVGGADLDWYGCNIYVGWYSSTSSNNPTSQINTRLNNVTNRPIAYSEYGCGGTQICHSETPSSTTNKGSGGARHDIEYQMWYHEGHVAAIKNFPQLIFTAEWQFFDVAVASRNEGYTICLDGETTFINDDLRRLNDKGLVERDHMTKKDTFYLYKAWWNQTDKFVHICGKDYEKLTNRVIKCYTNDGDSLTLYVNNTEIETVNVTNNIATFTARTFGPGDVIRVNGSTKNDTFTFSKNYLTFTALESGTFSFSTNDIQYSLDNGTSWTTLTAGSSTPTVAAGNKIMFKASGLTPTYGIGKFFSTGKFIASGNVMSLYYGDNYNNQTSLSGKTYAFYNLFNNCTKLISAKNLLLPATTLASGCYSNMFQYCSSLISAPELPATTLVSSCYYQMFRGCTSLTSVPELPATTLASSCYNFMFYGCTSLTTAPELPATTLVTDCYSNMFQGCTNLNYIKCLATNISSTYGCLTNWVDGVAQTGTFVKDKNMASWTIGTDGIPTGWNTYDTGTIDEYLTFDVKSNGTITWTANSSSNTKTISYSTDDGSTWTNITSSTSGASINVSAGDKVMFKGDNSAYSTNVYDYYNYFNSTATFDVYGNIMSLIGGDNFLNLTTLSNYAFRYLFYNNRTTLISVENLILPATTLAEGCYYGMFYGCTSLTTVPDLPATTLADYCYSYMFSGCTSLTTSPALPATTLASYCYYNMFSHCTLLTTVPDLPATTLASYCYWGMFENCTSLTTAPTLPATTLTNYCYANMFQNCTSLTTAPTLPTTTLAGYCYYNMFSGCTSLTTAPNLPATTLESSCYSGMFNGCTGLTTAPELQAPTLVNYCYQNMFRGCTNLNYIKCLATDISENNCTNHWVDGVAQTGTFVKALSMSGWTTGNNGIPTGWTIEDDYTNEYLTFDIKSSGSIIWKRNTAGWGTSITDKTIYYSKNDGSWTSLTSSTEGTSISVTTGDKLVFRGFNDYYATYDSPQGGPRYYSNIVFSGTAGFNVYGNILSLIYGNTFANYNSFVSNTNSVFYGLFKNAKVLSAENLILPVSSLVAYCYCQMFNGCTTLTKAPELPATTLAGSCYYNMFQGCTSLTTAPALSATTLAESCYADMFNGCTSLTTAPELPATTLTSSCYANMFRDCTSLTTAPELPATTLAWYCYANMFYGCSSLTTAPELPATTLTTYSYYYIFRNCTHINYIKCLAKDITATDCTTNWVNGVAVTGTFVKDSSMTDWSTGNDGIPSGWTVTNNS